jgi:CubicO group peptidase (beta-lactamase class C family)
MHASIPNGAGMRGLPAVALNLALAASAAAAQAPGPASPLDSVSRYVESEMARLKIPGVSIAILRGDSVVLARGYGYANVEVRAPATDSTIYQSGSVGKQFTSAAVMMLVGEGRLTLDDPVAKWLPEGAGAWKGITIRHLLTHTSGIPDYADSTLDYRRDYTEDELVRYAAKLPPAFAPGQRWSYSNTGYVLLGAIIRKASGQFYGDFLRERVFAPLGMRTARIISEEDIVPNRAAGYRLVRGELKNQNWVSPTLNTTADGALYLTVHDLALWAVALNRGQTPSRAILDASWTPVRLNDGGTYPYGFGWSLGHQRGARVIGHTGSWQGFKSAILRYPDHRLTVILLANLAETPQAAIASGIAGIMEPTLTPPHLLPPGRLKAASGVQPDALLRALASGDSTVRLTPGLRRFRAPTDREGLARLLARARAVTPLGCESVAGRGVNQLGAAVATACYVRVEGPQAGALVTVLYTGDRQVAAVERYGF